MNYVGITYIILIYMYFNNHKVYTITTERSGIARGFSSLAGNTVGASLEYAAREAVQSQVRWSRRPWNMPL